MRFAAAVSPVLQRLDLSYGYTERATPSLAEPAVPEQMIIWVIPRINPPAIRSPSLFRLVRQCLLSHGGTLDFLSHPMLRQTPMDLLSSTLPQALCLYPRQ